MSVLIPALGLIMFGAVFLLLPFGFPVGFTLMGVALLFSVIGHLLGAFDLPLLTALPQRLIGLMENDLLQAIPMFVYLGVIMQRTTLAAEDRKSTRLNSSHMSISYAVFCLKKKSTNACDHRLSRHPYQNCQR